MINLDELYAYAVDYDINGQGSEGVIGKLTFTYEARQVISVKNLKKIVSYNVMCTHRITLTNPSRYDLVPLKIADYNSYPAMISIETEPEFENNDLKIIDYAPRTLNTTVMTSTSQSDGTNNSYTNQHTSGSSTSQTNSYETNLGIGFFGDMATGNAGFGYGQSNTRSFDNSNSVGSEKGTSRSSSSDSSMSIMDWGSYATLDAQRIKPKWIWGQEYPWDVIRFRCCPSSNEVVIPQFIKNRLFDLSCKPPVVFPPSHLSLFGLDFSMAATWNMSLGNTIKGHSIKFKHIFKLLTASHGIKDDSDGAKVGYARLGMSPSQLPFESPCLDLTLLGLDPIASEHPGPCSVIGFNSTEFLIEPDNGCDFKTISTDNNLQVTGNGFDKEMATSNKIENAKLIVQFKIIDDAQEYSLFFKHWKLNSAGHTLKICINNNTNSILLRHVDDYEGTGGANNMLELSLRNKDYSSIDYHDYLVLGLNTITIDIYPSSSEDEISSYQLRALSLVAN